MNRFAMAQQATRRQTKRSASTHDAAFREKRACWILVALCVLAYLPNIAAAVLGYFPLSGDILSAFAPWREYSRAALSDGVLPLWNSRVFCGSPFLPNAQTSVLYPPNVVYWIFPLPIALLLDAIGHNIVLALGAFTLARALGISKSGAFVTACALAFSGAVAARVNGGHLTWHDTRAYIPWLLWSLLMYLRGVEYSGRPRKFYLVSMVLLFALQIFAGHPPVSLLTGALCLGLWLAYAVSTRQVQAIWLRDATLVGGMIFALAAALLLPMREISRLSTHGTELSYYDAVLASGNWHSLFRLLSPDFFGGNSLPEWSISIAAGEEAAYGGVLTLFLALGTFSLTRRKDGSWPRAVPWLVVLIIFAAMLAMGKHLPVYRMVFEVCPPFRLTRIPVRWLEVWAICAALLAGFGLDGLWKRKQNRQILRTLCFVSMLLMGCAMVWAGWNPGNGSLWQSIAHIADVSQDARFLRETAGILRQRALLESLATVLIVLFLLWGLRHPRGRLILPGVLVFDLMLAFWKSALLTPAEMYNQEVRWPERLVRDYDQNSRWDGQMSNLAYNNNIPAGVDVVGGYDPLTGTSISDYFSAMLGRKQWLTSLSSEKPNPLLRVAGTTHLLSLYPPVKKWRGKVVMNEIKREGSWRLWRYRWQAWPREYFAFRVLDVPREEQLAALKRQSEIAATSALPIIAEEGVFAPSLARRTAKVLYVQRHWNRTKIEVFAPEGGILVQADTLYPGWSAFADGKQIPIQKANYLFRGVPIKAGTRQVDFVYNSWTFRFGLFLSLCGLGGLVGWAVVLRPRRMDNP